MNSVTENLCPYCFRQLPPGGECSCAYETSPNSRIGETLPPGTIVGACYQVGGVLGRGGFAITYRGYDLDLEKIVAIKEFFPEGMVARRPADQNDSGRINKTCEILVASPKNADVYRKSLELFYREARALGRLGDLPNVVHVYRIFRENNTAYIVMDYVGGKPLKKIIQEMGRVPEDTLLPLLDPVLTALQKVHEAGILHRDIAPDNIIINENGQPILLDFGAARIDSGSQSSLVIGKKGFSSLEQIAGGLQDDRSDIYSLGTIYYYALSGVKPQDSVMRAVTDSVVPLKELAPEISDRVSDAVMKAMAVKPDDRWASVQQFQNALNASDDPAEPETVSLSPGQQDSVPLFPDAADSLPEDDPGRTEVHTQTLAQSQNQPQPEEKSFPAERRRNYKLILLAVLVTAAAIIGAVLGRNRSERVKTPDLSLTNEPSEIRPQVGLPYYFGSYEQDNDPENGTEDIKWRILALEDDRALLISELALDMHDFNFARDRRISWETCDLRKWLNEDFYSEAFSEEEKGRILESVIPNSDLPSDNTYDRIFLLSYDEAGEYFSTDASRQCRATDYARNKGADVFDSSGKTRWWLRSGNEDPGSTQKWAAVVWAYGSREYISDFNTITGVAVRPVMWIRLK